MYKELNNAISNILKINWRQIQNTHSKANVKLAIEYMRRAALFKYTLTSSCPLPFFDAAKAIGKKTQLDILDICPEIQNIENQFVKNILQFYLEWTALVDEGDPVANQFGNLYEPLIKLFERGGSVGVHHGELVVGNASIQYKKYQLIASWEPIDISDDSLEKYDKEVF